MGIVSRLFDEYELNSMRPKFKPSWVGLRESQQLVLIDWAQEAKPEGRFDPRYAVHVIGLGFSDILPDSFQDSGRLLVERLYYFG